jgi:hypothetical protein
MRAISGDGTTLVLAAAEQISPERLALSTPNCVAMRAAIGARLETIADTFGGLARPA